MRNNDFSSNTSNSIRIEQELSQGRNIKENAENIWGWASPAGKIRASRRAQYFLKLTNMNSDCDVLEIGCGTGIFTEKVAQE
jgi:2-polyprenyl-3-methyl-5-hydroxy-6-metoxy-1,4-benzoquinol methylase